MNERIIDLILYLVSQIRKNTPIDSIDVKVLSADGYTDAEIGAAFSWIVDQEAFRPLDQLTRRTGFRVLHEAERAIFPPDAYGYLLQLMEIGILNDFDLENLINRMHFGGSPPLSVRDIKDLIPMVLAERSEDRFDGTRLMLNAHDTVH